MRGSFEGRARGLTPKSAELSSGSLTGRRSIKLNAFHCDEVRIKYPRVKASNILMSGPFGLVAIWNGEELRSWSSPRCARATCAVTEYICSKWTTTPCQIILKALLDLSEIACF